MQKLAAPIRVVTDDQLAAGARAGLAADATIGDLSFNGRSVSIGLLEVISDVVIEQTRKGAPMLEVVLRDADRSILRSKMLQEITTAKLGGVSFRRRGGSKRGDQVTLRFELELVAAMRSLKRRRVQVRSADRTRAMFVRDRVREVRPVPTFVCPELTELQPIVSAAGAPARGQQDDARGGGFAPGASITVKHVKADTSQRRNIERVLTVGASMRAPRTVQLAAIVTVTQESVARNLTGGDLDSVGLFQQRPSQGWPASRDVEKDAKAFYTAALGEYRSNPSIAAPELAQAVQRSAYPTAYRAWLSEAKTTLEAFDGGGATTAPDSKYLFTIGPPGGEKGEDYWTGLQRLAEEVQWSLWVVADAVYYMSDDAVYASRPRMTLSEEDPYVEGIDFDLDDNFHVNDAEAVIRGSVWAVPPGSVVLLADVGPANGRWIVETTRRSLYASTTQLTFSKPRAKLAEPAAEQVDAASGSAQATPPAAGTTSALAAVKLGTEWQGTKSIFTQYVHPFMKGKGLEPGSQKRPSSTTDHGTTTLNAYATDYPTYTGEAAARALATDMGYPSWQPNSYNTFNVSVGGKRFRVQILWGGGIAHGDHVHVGIRRL